MRVVNTSYTKFTKILRDRARGARARAETQINRAKFLRDILRVRGLRARAMRERAQENLARSPLCLKACLLSKFQTL